MLGNGAFSKGEVERLLKAPHILQDFFKRSAELGWTVAAEQIRSTYWEIETHATRLRRMAKGWSPEPGDKVTWNPEAVRVLNAAADELDRLATLAETLRADAASARDDASRQRWSDTTRGIVF